MAVAADKDYFWAILQLNYSFVLPSQIGRIEHLKEVCNYFGKDFWLESAKEASIVSV